MKEITKAVESAPGWPVTAGGEAAEPMPTLEGVAYAGVEDFTGEAAKAALRETAKRLRLYDVVEQLRIVEGWIDEALEADPEAEGALSATLAELLKLAELTLETKVANVALMWRALDKEAKLLEEEKRRLDARAKARERVSAHLRLAAVAALSEAGIQKVKDPRVTVWLQKEPDAIEWTLAPEAIPEPFRKPPVIELSKTAAREYLERLGTLPAGFVVTTGRVGIRSR